MGLLSTFPATIFLTSKSGISRIVMRIINNKYHLLSIYCIKTSVLRDTHTLEFLICGLGITAAVIINDKDHLLNT